MKRFKNRKIDKCLSPLRYRTWLIKYYFLFIYKIKEWINIIEIGEVLKSTRESSGLSLDEVSKDLDIPEISLTQIEEGNIGAFKDLFELKKILTNYSKYLGLNSTEVIDEFNEFMFEKTSKLQIKKIEEALKEDRKEEAKETRIASPYTRVAPLKSNKSFVMTIILIMVLVVLAILWSIKQVTVGNISAIW